LFWSFLRRSRLCRCWAMMGARCDDHWAERNHLAAAASEIDIR
jgi:hypothetical protein